MMYQNLTEM